MNIDAWVVFDHLGKDPTGKILLGEYWPITRQYLIFILHSKIIIVKSSIESETLSKFVTPNLQVHSYSSVMQLQEILQSIAKRQKFNKIALNYDLENPEVDLVPAGRYHFFTEIVKSVNPKVEFLSAKDLLQQLVAVLTPEDLHDHRQSAKECSEIMETTFNWLQDRITTTKKTTERDTQQYIMKRFTEYGMVTSDPPVVAAGSHSADPHYGGADYRIPPNVPLLIDLWAKHRIYGDMTWMAFTGRNPPQEFQESFNHVIKARDIGINTIKPNIEAWKVDAAVRHYLKQNHLDQYFIHRTGHSIDTAVHGKGANLDSFEMQEKRRLLPGLVVSVEPGVYLTGKWGIRSEVDVIVTPKGSEVTTSIQKNIVLLH
ncbi:MAG: M24 family metallopeptidase [Candidatus Ranarchaeia archaeon]|jgi:Xaa-Pro aminopeptidase